MKLISEKHPVTVCFLWVLIAYLPVASFQFAIKNDFFTSYFPLKYFLTESIRAGIFPLWNPFLNYGFPVYGDISLGYWNPLTWLISATAGYNPWTFTIEIILYLFIACSGMYTLSGLWINSTRVKQLCAVSFACSGFFIGHLQHFNWIAGAAMVPYCLYSLIGCIKTGEMKFYLAAVISWCWFISSAHPGITIGSILFTIPLLLHLQLIRKKEILRAGLTALTVLIVCSGMVFAYLEVLPFTNRSGAVGSLVNPAFATGWRSWISLFFSLPTTKAETFFGNDIAMRNCFFGILLLASIAVMLQRKLRGSGTYFLYSGLAFLVLSSELILPVYKFIPLLNYVRLNSEFRIFAILSFILSGGISLQQIIENRDNKLQRSLKIFRIIYALAIAGALGYLVISGDSLWTSIRQAGVGRPGIKSLLNGLSFADTILIHAVIQVLICSFLINGLKKFDTGKVLLAGFAEIAIAALLNLPFTGVGQRSVQDIAHIIAQSPAGIQAPRMVPESEVVSGYPDTKLIVGDWSLFSKQIAMDSLFPYPLMFNETLELAQGDGRKSLMSRPPIFLDSGAPIDPEAVQYSFLETRVKTSSPEMNSLVIKQNYYPRWHALIDGKPAPVHQYKNAFLNIPVPPGQHDVKIRFTNKLIKPLLFFEFFMLLFAAIYLLMNRRDQRIRYIFP